MITAADILNSKLADIASLAEQARICDDAAVKRMAIGDLYHAIASILPVGCRASGDVGAEPGRRMNRACKEAAPRAEVIVVKTPDTTVMSYVVGAGGPALRKLSAEIHRYGIAKLYDGDKLVAAMDFSDDCKRKAVYKIVRCGLNGLISVTGHARRNRANRKRRVAAEQQADYNKGAADDCSLLPFAELAAPVTRKQIEDDIAERMENA